MSETATQDPTDQDAPEPADAPIESQVTETQAEPTEAEQPQPDPTPKPNRGDRRFSQLAARNAALEAELAEARRARESAEALVRAGKPDADPEQPAPISREAIRAEIRYETQRDGVIERGNTEYGAAAFAEQASILAGLGATQNRDFMAVLVEMPNAEKIVAALSDDTDALLNMMSKTPAGMAAEMGRMSARLETTAAKPPKVAASRAPVPVTPIRAATVVPEIDPYKIGTAEEWKAYREKTAPKRLGGRG